MEEWEDYCRVSTTRLARQLAFTLPLLEKFDWYISDPSTLVTILDNTPYGFDDYPGFIMAWNWRIRRYDSRRKPIRVFGDLNYSYSTRECPPPFYILVGQESDRHVTYYDYFTFGRSYLTF